ncbi:MAG: hypothetical protein EXS63_05130 [Candidatus Omnitrophica bacterium]|nr:hypothetical protein [Candidatus Omnitrophota bacterium]
MGKTLTHLSKSGEEIMPSLCHEIDKLTHKDNFPHITLDREEQFEAYFNNRMAVLLLWIECPKNRDEKSKLQMEFFFHDLEHHFVEAHASKDIRKAFLWLKAYIHTHPRFGKKYQSFLAFEMMTKIYQVIGIRLPSALQKILPGKGETAAC